MDACRVGSNYKLTDKKLSSEATKPFRVRVEEPLFLYLRGCGDDIRTSVEPCAREAHAPVMSNFVDDIRAQFELGDSGLLTLIEQVRAITAMVEAEGHVVAHLPLVARGPVSKKVRASSGSGPSPRQSKAPRRIPPGDECGTAQQLRQ
jgi:hypothetical protein